MCNFNDEKLDNAMGITDKLILPVICNVSYRNSNVIPNRFIDPAVINIGVNLTSVFFSCIT